MKRWNNNPLDLWPRVEQRKLVLEGKTHTIKNRITKKSTRQEESPEKSKKQEKCKTCIFLSCCFCFVFFLFLLLVCCLFFNFLVFFLEFGFLVFFCSLWFCFFCQTLYSLCCWTHNIRHGAYNCHWRLTVQPNQVKQVYVMETRWMLAKCCTSW